MSEFDAAPPTTRELWRRAGICLAISAALAVGCYFWGLNGQQILAATVFTVTVLATLFFWRFRLAIAFLGIATLMACNVLSLDHFIESCELPIIMFLVGMMVTIAVLKELGFFTWIIQLVINIKGLTGRSFVLIMVLLSALMACVVDEVTSIVFVCALIFQVCDTLKVRPTPFVIIAVMSTNVGSCGTMLGNPVGLLIGFKAKLGFHHFLIWAFPVMLLCLTATLGMLMAWFRKDIALLDAKLRERREMGRRLGPIIRVPYKRGLAILVLLITGIALHHPLEQLLGIKDNTILMAAPLVVAGVLMIWRHERARDYIENQVEWWTLLFFMMLFAKAGTLKFVGITARIATDFSDAFKGMDWAVMPVVMITSAIGSAFVDNVVFVAAFTPVVKGLVGDGQPDPLWWALLFGACFGGNITMIGSTANIVALGMLEKRYRSRINFMEWLKIGLLTGLVSCVIAWAALLITGPIMLSMHEKQPEKKTEMSAPEEPGEKQTEGQSGDRSLETGDTSSKDGKDAIKKTTGDEPETEKAIEKKPNEH
jgi:Na+/H+ antiporter NhaD/arsenite permease-like protein